MTTKLIARLALVVIALGLLLGNYWFTFGLWPRSWPSFVFFGCMAILVQLLHVAIDRSDE